MGKLKLNFLPQEQIGRGINPIEEILYQYGQEICDYAKGYFNYIVTTTSFEEDVREAALYIIVSEIGFDYKVLELSYINVENISLKFFTLKTGQVEDVKVSVKDNNWELVDNKIAQILNTELANKTFKFLVDQIHLKRDESED
jgi:hypothetical protein